MIAVFEHELKIYFHSLTAYVFGAFLLVFTGIGALVYNINAAVSNFEYVLSFCSVVFVVIVPILTMRVIAEERKQKTDQLIYAMPITTTEVVVGKFLALLVVFFIPMLIIAVYPLIFAKYGEVSLLTAYGSLIAFFIMGAALLAFGMFTSSLTDNQGFAAGIGIAAILFNYFSVSLAEYVSATAFGSLVVLSVIVFILTLVIQHLTKNDYAACGIGFVLFAILMVTYYFKMDQFEGLLPKIMTRLSLFKQFNIIVNGVFDLTAIAYFLSVMVFFLFLCVQSLEKRRYN